MAGCLQAYSLGAGCVIVGYCGIHAGAPMAYVQQAMSTKGKVFDCAAHNSRSRTEGFKMATCYAVPELLYAEKS